MYVCLQKYRYPKSAANTKSSIRSRWNLILFDKIKKSIKRGLCVTVHSYTRNRKIIFVFVCEGRNKQNILIY